MQMNWTRQSGNACWIWRAPATVRSICICRFWMAGSRAAAQLRDRAALLMATHPAWTGAPHEVHTDYFRTWQAVSIAVQKALRRWVPDIYFADPARFEDRDAAFPLLVYAASRPCRGLPSSE